MATISERLQYILQFDTRQAIAAVDQFGKKADQALDKDAKLDKLGSNMTKFGAAAVAAAGVAGMGLWKVAQGASDLNESINAVEVSYGDAGKEVTKLGESAAQSFGLSRRQFNEMATMFGGFAKDLATGGKSSVDVLKEMTGRAADFGSVFNINVAEAGRLFQSGLAGETEALRRFGIDLSSAAVEAYALENGISENVKTMTQAEKLTARYGLLMQETETYAGDFANTSGSLANQQRILAANVQNLKDGIGMGLLPMFNTLIGVTGKVVNVFGGMSAETQSMVGKLAAIGVTGLGVVGTLSMVAGQAVKLRTRFVDATGQLNAFGKAAKGASVALAAVGLSVAAFEILNQIQDTAGKASRNVEELNVKLAEFLELKGVEQAGDTLKEFRDIVGNMDSELRPSHLWEDWGKRVVIAGGEAARSIEDIDRAFNKVLEESGPQAARGMLQAWELQNEQLDHSSQQYADNTMLIERYSSRLDSTAASVDALAKVEQDAANTEAARANALDGQLNIMSDVEIAQGRLRDTTVQATEDQTKAWEDWSSSLLEQSEAAQGQYDAMATAAQEWAADIRSAIDKGAESFIDFGVKQGESAEEYAARLETEIAATRNWESTLATVIGQNTSYTENQKGVLLQHFGDMGQAGADLVTELSKAPPEIQSRVFDAILTGSAETSDGMLGSFDPVADGLSKRMVAAQRQLGIALANIKYEAAVKSREIGVAIPDGVRQGVQDGQGALNRQVRTMLQGALAAAEQTIEKRSPSHLFAREVGAPIVEGVAAGIAEEGDKISKALESAIESAEKDAVRAAEDLVDAADDVLSGLWGEIGDQRSEADQRERVADAERDLAEAFAGGDPEKIARARESLEDANYALAKSTEYMLGMDEASRRSWIETAAAAGITASKISALITAYDQLAEATRKANEEKAAIAEEALRAQKVRTDFDQFVAAGLISPDQLNHLSTQNSASQLYIMQQYMDAIVATFPKFHRGGVVPGPAGAEVPIMARAGEVVSTGAPVAPTITLVVNAGLGVDGNVLGRQLVDILNSYFRNGGQRFVASATM